MQIRLNNLHSSVAIWPVSPSSPPPVVVVWVRIPPAIVPIAPIAPSIAIRVVIPTTSVVSRSVAVTVTHVLTANRAQKGRIMKAQKHVFSHSKTHKIVV